MFGFRKIRNEKKTMPDFNKQYRITTKNNKYRLEGKFEDGWVVLSRTIDNVEEAKKLRLQIIKSLEEEWIIKNDTEGWTAIEL